jgi:hypothetical protein
MSSLNGCYGVLMHLLSEGVLRTQSKLITLINGRKEKHPRKIITFTLANYIGVRLMAWANDDPRLRPIVVTARKAKHRREGSTNELDPEVN